MGSEGGVAEEMGRDKGRVKSGEGLSLLSGESCESGIWAWR